MDDFITVTATGGAITTGAASARIAIPTASSGEVPRYIRVASTQACYVKLGGATVAATANDLLIQPADSEILHIPNGVTYIAAIQDSVAGKCSVVPLENM